MSEVGTAIYLGDGLYFQDEGFHVKLFGHNGTFAHDTVYLDDDCLKKFIEALAGSRYLIITTRKRNPGEIPEEL